MSVLSCAGEMMELQKLLEIRNVTEGDKPNGRNKLSG